MSLAPPRPTARCAASGCARRASTSSATRGPRGEDPEALLRAALTGGVDIVQLREKELPRREIERAAPHLPPRLRHLQRPLHRQRRSRPGARLRRRRRPRRPGRRCRRARRGRCSGPTRSSASRPTPRSRSRPRAEAPGRLHQRRPDLGDADEGRAPRGRARADLPRRRATRPIPSSRSAASTRATRRGRRGRRAAALRGAGDPRRRRSRRPPPSELRARLRRRLGEEAPGG